MKPILFLLQMPFEDGPGSWWFCSDCALIEGALKVNPQWAAQIDVKRIAFPKPRKEIIEMLGEEHQWLPALVLSKHEVINNPVEITRYLAFNFGGAAPHP